MWQNIIFSKYFTENGENSPQNNSLKLLACHQNMAQFPNFSTFLRTQNWLSPLVDDCAEHLPFTKFEKEKYTLPANKVESCFFLGGSTLGCSQSDIDPQEDLAKFGYKLKFMKVRKI